MWSLQSDHHLMLSVATAEWARPSRTPLYCRRSNGSNCELLIAPCGLRCSYTFRGIDAEAAALPLSTYQRDCRPELRREINETKSDLSGCRSEPVAGGLFPSRLLPATTTAATGPRCHRATRLSRWRDRCHPRRTPRITTGSRAPCALSKAACPSARDRRLPAWLPFWIRSSVSPWSAPGSIGLEGSVSTRGLAVMFSV